MVENPEVDAPRIERSDESEVEVPTENSPVENIEKEELVWRKYRDYCVCVSHIRGGLKESCPRPGGFLWCED